MPTQVQDDQRAARILQRKAEGSLGVDDAIAELADCAGGEAIAGLIAERIAIPADLIARAIDAPSDDDLSVICRVAGLTMNSYSALLRMRRRGNRGEGHPTAALKLFAELSQAAAKQKLAQRVPGFGQRRPASRRGR